MNFLLKHFLNWFLFAGTMFLAAGATIGDVGAGGGDGDSSDAGADVGAGDDSSAGADSDGSEDGHAAGDDGQSDGDEDPLAERSQENADPDAPVDLGDGRQVPGRWKKLFDAAKTAGLEKEAKQLYFANARLQKVIPGGVNGAIELAKSVEQFGGLEGVEQLQADIKSYRDDSELFERGDARWIESSFSENPDISLKHFVNAQNYISEHHPEFFDHLAAKTIIADLDAHLDVRGIHSLLSGMKDNPQAQQLAKKLADYYNTRDELQRKTPEKKVDPQQKALSEREQKAEAKEMELRFKDVNGQVFPQMKTDVFGALAAEAKGVGADLDKIKTEFPGAYREMLNTIQREIMKAALKDERFVEKHHNLVKKNDLKRAAAAVNKKHSEIIPDIVRAVVKDSGLLKGKPKPNADGNQNRPGADQGNNKSQGWEMVNKKPENSLIDYQKSPLSLTSQGRYVLKSGKKIQVRY